MICKVFQENQNEYEDKRINRAAFSQQRTSRYILAFDPSASFENKDEADFERIIICQKIVDLIFSDGQEDLLIALEDIENCSKKGKS